MTTGSAFVDVVFDGPPSNKTGRFVDCEGPGGVGVNAGRWIDRGDGYWALRIPLHATPAPSPVAETVSVPSVTVGRAYDGCEFAWLIERTDTSVPTYWVGRGAGCFSYKPDDAVRFARKEDGEIVLGWIVREQDRAACEVREHGWMRPLPESEPEPPRHDDEGEFGPVNLNGVPLDVLRKPVAPRCPACPSRPTSYSVIEQMNGEWLLFAEYEHPDGSGQHSVSQNGVPVEVRARPELRKEPVAPEPTCRICLGTGMNVDAVEAPDGYVPCDCAAGRALVPSPVPADGLSAERALKLAEGLDMIAKTQAVDFEVARYLRAYVELTAQLAEANEEASFAAEESAIYLKARNELQEQLADRDRTIAEQKATIDDLRDTCKRVAIAIGHDLSNQSGDALIASARKLRDLYTNAARERDGLAHENASYAVRVSDCESDHANVAALQSRLEDAERGSAEAKHERDDRTTCTFCARNQHVSHSPLVRFACVGSVLADGEFVSFCGCPWRPSKLKNFDELLAKMPLESRQRVEDHAEELLAQMDSMECGTLTKELAAAEARVKKLERELAGAIGERNRAINNWENQSAIVADGRRQLGELHHQRAVAESRIASLLETLHWAMEQIEKWKDERDTYIARIVVESVLPRLRSAIEGEVKNG